MRPTAPSVPATLLKGFCMGAADVVPGVSGGTMALILGIYERLLSAIRHVDLAFIGLLLRGRLGAAASHVDLAFLALLGTGILAALLFFTRVVSLPRLVVEQPELIYGLFFGLIVANNASKSAFFGLLQRVLLLVLISWITVVARHAQRHGR